MIQLTRLNNHPLVVNSDLIKFVEQAPDTVITLVSGEKIVVRERALDVLDRVVEFRRSVLQGIVICSALPPILNSPANGAAGILPGNTDEDARRLASDGQPTGENKER